MTTTKKLFLSNAVLSILLFLVLFARWFYSVGQDDVAGVDWLLCIYYFAVAVCSVVLWHKMDLCGKGYFIAMAVFCLLLPVILWIWVLIDCLQDGIWESFYFIRNWHLFVATLVSVVMAVIHIVVGILQNKKP